MKPMQNWSCVYFGIVTPCALIRTNQEHHLTIVSTPIYWSWSPVYNLLMVDSRYPCSSKSYEILKIPYSDSSNMSVDLILIHSDYRKQGIGYMLLEDLIEYCTLNQIRKAQTVFGYQTTLISMQPEAFSCYLS